MVCELSGGAEGIVIGGQGCGGGGRSSSSSSGELTLGGEDKCI